MMRPKIVVVLACALLQISSLTANADGKDGKPNMNGTWLPTAGEMAGKKFPDAVLKSMKLELEGEKYTVTVDKVIDRGTVKMDATAKPMTMDITGTEGPNKGKTILAICEVDGNTMKVCYDLSGKARPTAFESKEGSLLFLATYKRQKP